MLNLVVFGVDSSIFQLFPCLEGGFFVVLTPLAAQDFDLTGVANIAELPPIRSAIFNASLGR